MKVPSKLEAQLVLAIFAKIIGSKINGKTIDQLQQKVKSNMQQLQGSQPNILRALRGGAKQAEGSNKDKQDEEPKSLHDAISKLDFEGESDEEKSMLSDMFSGMVSQAFTTGKNIADYAYETIASQYSGSNVTESEKAELKKKINTKIENEINKELDFSSEKDQFNDSNISNAIKSNPELFQNLESIILTDQDITNFKTLDGLMQKRLNTKTNTFQLNNDKLINLDISGTKITHITGIKNFTKLESLNISNTEIKDLNVLMPCKNLKTLKITKKQYSEMEDVFDKLASSLGCNILADGENIKAKDQARQNTESLSGGFINALMDTVNEFFGPDSDYLQDTDKEKRKNLKKAFEAKVEEDLKKNVEGEELNSFKNSITKLANIIPNYYHSFSEQITGDNIIKFSLAIAPYLKDKNIEAGKAVFDILYSYLNDGKIEASNNLISGLSNYIDSKNLIQIIRIASPILPNNRLITGLKMIDSLYSNARHNNRESEIKAVDLLKTYLRDGANIEMGKNFTNLLITYFADSEIETGYPIIDLLTSYSRKGDNIETGIKFTCLLASAFKNMPSLPEEFINILKEYGKELRGEDEEKQDRESLSVEFINALTDTINEFFEPDSAYLEDIDEKAFEAKVEEKFSSKLNDYLGIDSNSNDHVGEDIKSAIQGAKDKFINILKEYGKELRGEDEEVDLKQDQARQDRESLSVGFINALMDTINEFFGPDSAYLKDIDEKAFEKELSSSFEEPANEVIQVNRVGDISNIIPKGPQGKQEIYDNNEKQGIAYWVGNFFSSGVNKFNDYVEKGTENLKTFSNSVDDVLNGFSQPSHYNVFAKLNEDIADIKQDNNQENDTQSTIQSFIKILEEYGEELRGEGKEVEAKVEEKLSSKLNDYLGIDSNDNSNDYVGEDIKSTIQSFIKILKEYGEELRGEESDYERKEFEAKVEEKLSSKLKALKDSIKYNEGLNNDLEKEYLNKILEKLISGNKNESNILDLTHIKIDKLDNKELKVLAESKFSNLLDNLPNHIEHIKLQDEQIKQKRVAFAMQKEMVEDILKENKDLKTKEFLLGFKNLIDEAKQDIKEKQTESLFKGFGDAFIKTVNEFFGPDPEYSQDPEKEKKEFEAKVKEEFLPKLQALKNNVIEVNVIEDISSIIPDGPYGKRIKDNIEKQKNIESLFEKFTNEFKGAIPNDEKLQNKVEKDLNKFKNEIIEFVKTGKMPNIIQEERNQTVITDAKNQFDTNSKVTYNKLTKNKYNYIDNDNLKEINKAKKEHYDIQMNQQSLTEHNNENIQAEDVSLANHMKGEVNGKKPAFNGIFNIPKQRQGSEESSKENFTTLKKNVDTKLSTDEHVVTESKGRFDNLLTSIQSKESANKTQDNENTQTEESVQEKLESATEYVPNQFIGDNVASNGNNKTQLDIDTEQTIQQTIPTFQNYLKDLNSALTNNNKQGKEELVNDINKCETQINNILDTQARGQNAELSNLLDQLTKDIKSIEDNAEKLDIYVKLNLRGGDTKSSLAVNTNNALTQSNKAIAVKEQVETSKLEKWKGTVELRIKEQNAHIQSEEERITKDINEIEKENKSLQTQLDKKHKELENRLKEKHIVENAYIAQGDSFMKNFNRLKANIEARQDAEKNQVDAINPEHKAYQGGKEIAQTFLGQVWQRILHGNDKKVITKTTRDIEKIQIGMQVKNIAIDLKKPEENYKRALEDSEMLNLKEKIAENNKQIKNLKFEKKIVKARSEAVKFGYTVILASVRLAIKLGQMVTRGAGAIVSRVQGLNTNTNIENSTKQPQLLGQNQLQNLQSLYDVNSQLSRNSSNEKKIKKGQQSTTKGKTTNDVNSNTMNVQ